jgi:para-aminobenzoate synthetase component 1
MSLAARATLLVCEIPWRAPDAAFAAWRRTDRVAWLDSGGPVGARSRYSYLCVQPFRVLEATAGCVTIDGMPVNGDPFGVLQTELERFRMEAGAMPVPFAGGAVGFLGYELAHCLEQLPARHQRDPAVPDMSVAFYDMVLGFDRLERRCWLVSSGFPETAADRRRARAEARCAAMLRRLEAACPGPVRGDPAVLPAVAWRPDLERSAYLAQVRRALEYIRAGDIFEVNFTMRHVAPRPAGLVAADVHLALRERSPAPFTAFLDCGPDLAIVSASPERFLHLDGDGMVESRPIKGTRPRDPDPAADEALRRALGESPKDRAENLMIVDLMRNDIGRVAQLGSVRVPGLWEVESFPAVHQLVSSVTGRLRPGLGPVDLLRATFPGGSVTGAPKIRAMEIVDELEMSRRGPYCGSIARIGFDGTMDSSIVIRTLVLTADRLVAQAGGAIVADSDPEEEYLEMLTKIRPLLDLFGGSRFGGVR